jgi:hypothetical protein
MQRGRAVHCIFSFPKKGKEKDAIPIPHAKTFSEQDFYITTLQTVLFQQIYF